MAVLQHSRLTNLQVMVHSLDQTQTHLASAASRYRKCVCSLQDDVSITLVSDGSVKRFRASTCMLLVSEISRWLDQRSRCWLWCGQEELKRSWIGATFGTIGDKQAWSAGVQSFIFRKHYTDASLHAYSFSNIRIGKHQGAPHSVKLYHEPQY